MSTSPRGQALVVGGSRGIGRAIAVELASSGWDVAFTWTSNRDAARTTLEELGTTGCALRTHLGRPDAVEQLCGDLDSAGVAPHLLVFSPAYGSGCATAAVSSTQMAKTLQVHCTSFVGLVQALRSLDCAVAFSSPGAHVTIPDYCDVGVAKAALESAVRYLAAGPDIGSRVYAVSPGFVATDSGRAVAERLALRRPAAPDTVALGDWETTLDDVVDTVTSLLAEDCPWPSGTTLALWDSPSGPRWPVERVSSGASERSDR